MTAAGLRYAIYFAPDHRSALWRFGSSVLGYDAVSGQDVVLAAPAGLTVADWATLTEEPRQYGFHATLVAPCHLREGATEADYLEAVQAFAGTMPVAVIPQLKVTQLGSFLALTIDGDFEPVAALSAAAVRALSPWRASLSSADLARRLAANLTPRQIQNLVHYGYPYVLEDFRFHMTLTGSLPAPRRADLAGKLAESFAVQVPSGVIPVDAICAFRQDRRDGRFRIISRFPLGRLPSDASALQ